MADKDYTERFDDNDLEIDFRALVKRLRAGWKLIFKWVLIAFVVAAGIGYSIPKRYLVRSSFAPESSTGATASSSLASLANALGVNLNTVTKDAVYPEIYPEIVSSIPFITETFDLPVSFDRKGETIETDLFDYMKNYQRSAWWSYLLGLPGRLLSSEESEVIREVDQYRLTKTQRAVMKSVMRCIDMEVDKKTSYVEMEVMMQDPEVAAALSSFIMDNLQKYVSDYRTDKSRKNVEYLERMTMEAEVEYHEAQDKYAAYLDSHQGTVSQRANVEKERLQNDFEMKNQLYTQMRQGLLSAKAQVQQETPVFAVIQPATVPLKPAKPSKKLICVVFALLAFIGGCASVLATDGKGSIFKEV